MLTFAIIALSYCLISVALYFAMREKCKINPVFKAPKCRATYYILSFTWGLPMVLFGCLVALVLVVTGHKPKKYGWDWCFEFKGLGWGLELGIFFIAPAEECEHLKEHEHGHGIQNIYLGFFTPFVVSIPSAVRFWVREIKYNMGKKNLPPYDSVWFEGSASASGKALMERLRKCEKMSELSGDSTTI